MATKKDRTYNGHRNKSAWNISLWIGNDEGLYNAARAHIRRTKNRDSAALAMLADLHECGITETPDGVKYTKTNIRLAMVDL